MSAPDESVVVYRSNEQHDGFYDLCVFTTSRAEADDVEYRALRVAAYDALLARLNEAEARANTAKVAAELHLARVRELESFLSMLFQSHWDGTIGRPPTWHLRGDFRHVLAGMRGETLADAIAALGRGE